eukprot:scaffold99263_cov39-Cyclotella_meneghiniana.AAC.2
MQRIVTQQYQRSYRFLCQSNISICDVKVLIVDGHSQQQHRGCHQPPLLHIPQLENINYAFERYDNCRGLLFNNKLRMRECADSLACRLDLSEKQRLALNTTPKGCYSHERNMTYSTMCWSMVPLLNTDLCKCKSRQLTISLGKSSTTTKRQSKFKTDERRRPALPQKLHAVIVKCLGRAVFDANIMSAVATALSTPSWKRLGLTTAGQLQSRAIFCNPLSRSHPRRTRHNPYSPFSQLRSSVASAEAIILVCVPPGIAIHV